jgi:superfamily II DNA or RNA helicase
MYAATRGCTQAVAAPLRVISLPCRLRAVCAEEGRSATAVIQENSVAKSPRVDGMRLLCHRRMIPGNPISRAPEPRRWQTEALDRWTTEGRHGIAEVVTGGGKTTFAGLCSRQFLDDYPAGRVIVLVPTIALLDQWFVALQEDFGVASEVIATYSGEGIPQAPARFCLLVLNTARIEAPRLAALGTNFLIVDECHRVGSPENARSLAGEHTATLGLSATPRREYDDAYETVIERALGSLIFEYGYDDARRDEVIASFELVNVSVNMSPDEEERYERLSRQIATLVRRFHDGDDVESRIKRLLRERASVSANAAARVPVAVRIASQFPHERILIFHESISAADRIVQLLTQRGQRAAAYHSRIAPDIRRDNLRMFRRGELDTLVSCRALDEGVNVPEASVAVVASSTASGRQRVQRLGRVLRPAVGKSKAVIYTLYATKIEEGRLREEGDRLESVDRVTWLSARGGSDGAPPAA